MYAICAEPYCLEQSCVEWDLCLAARDWKEYFINFWLTCGSLKTLCQCRRQHPCLPLRIWSASLSAAITPIPSFHFFFLILLFNICGMNNPFFSSGMKNFVSSFVEEIMRMWIDQKQLTSFLRVAVDNLLWSLLLYVLHFWAVTGLCWSSVDMKCWLGKRDQEALH